MSFISAYGPGKRDDHRPGLAGQNDHGRDWGSVVAIVFAAIALLSFTLDHSVRLCASPTPPTQTAGR